MGSDAGRGLTLSSHPVNIHKSCQVQTHRYFLDLSSTCSEQVHKLLASCDFCGFSIYPFSALNLELGWASPMATLSEKVGEQP